ncbi:hypothetical protein Areg01_76620 [Actinoplanes regularis]|nr:hypothetical protein Areg01_76620 [Actinoplanes regularis]
MMRHKLSSATVGAGRGVAPGQQKAIAAAEGNPYRLFGDPTSPPIDIHKFMSRSWPPS